ncbi:MAG: hypothetical protein OEY06_12335 [Gammaproteobacteria bacterium]|nr:hypothetical protein [Gammaproteobacteria bacterium]
MKAKNQQSELGLELIQTQIENLKHRVNFDDVIRMKFLEQSARYLGVYVENTPKNLLDDRMIS